MARPDTPAKLLATAADYVDSVEQGTSDKEIGSDLRIALAAIRRASANMVAREDRLMRAAYGPRKS